jgi:hypothetical protein
MMEKSGKDLISSKAVDDFTYMCVIWPFEFFSPLLPALFTKGDPSCSKVMAAHPPPLAVGSVYQGVLAQTYCSSGNCNGIGPADITVPPTHGIQ